MNVLAVGAHFNNIEIGCGGALLRHIQKGDKIYMYVAATSGYLNSEREAAEGSEILSEDIKETIEIFGTSPIFGGFETLSLEFNDALGAKLTTLIRNKKIDLIYTHFPEDPQHDHIALSKASIHAGRRVPSILGYQCNTYQSERAFTPNFYIDISEVWDKKEQAMRVYSSNVGRVSEEKLRYFKNVAENNGISNGVKYAEGFQVIKWLEK